MAAQTFKTGDVVQLRSGGPKMTVDQQDNDQFEREMVWLHWFDGNTLKHATLPPDALMKTNAETGLTMKPE